MAPHLDTLIERIIRDGKRRLSTGDRALIQQLLDAYARARQGIASELIGLDSQIIWAIENADEPLTVAWMRRQSWYEALDASIQREVSQLERTVRNLTLQGQSLGFSESVATYRAMIEAAPFMGRVNAPALARWVSAIQPGSPIDRVLRQYGTEVDAGIREAITDGIVRGRGSSTVTRDIVTSVGDSIEPYKASRIVRTEMMRTYRGVARDQYETLPDDAITGYRWISARDSRTCASCLGMHGQVFPQYPGFQHVQCFPAGTHVNGPLARAATKRWYEGQLVEIVTASDQRLSVTPNHPILTSRGWVGAGELIQGDNVFRHVSPKGKAASINPDYENRPAFIEDIAESLMLDFNGVARLVPCTPEDFHGDGAYGQVDIVFSDSFLGDTGNSVTFQPVLDQELIRGGVGEPLFPSLGHAHEHVIRALAASYRLMCRTRERLSLFRGGLCHAQVHSVGAVAGRNPGLCQLNSYPAATGSQPFSDRLFGHPGFVPFRDFMGGGSKRRSAAQSSLSPTDGLPLFLAPDRDASLSENPNKSFAGDAEIAEATLKRLAGQVVPDEIVHIGVREFAGHVFNLQTTEGWYSANNIITHNCRCSVSPVFSERYAPPREYQTGDQWLREQPVERQQAVLGSSERYELWANGMPLENMVEVVDNPVWGGSTRLIPVRDLRP